MKANYYALMACIMNARLTIEQALARLGISVKAHHVYNTSFAQQIIEMRRDGVKWQAIGDMFGISPGAAYRRMAYYLQISGEAG